MTAIPTTTHGVGRVRGSTAVQRRGTGVDLHTEHCDWRSQNQGPKNQRACWKQPYRHHWPDGCNLNPDDFEVPGTVSAIAGFGFDCAGVCKRPFHCCRVNFAGAGGHWPQWCNPDHRAPHHHRAYRCRRAVVVRRLGPCRSFSCHWPAGCPGTWDACARAGLTCKITSVARITKPISRTRRRESMS